MEAFEEKVLATIQRYRMLSVGDKVLVAVSGGVDSMVLLAVLMRLPLRLGLAVFHLNHRLRPEAEDEAVLVAEYASTNSLPCHTERLAEDWLNNKGKSSLQEAARDVRYRLMVATADRLGITKIALGHHADDQAETVLMRFLTGAGPAGLAGIPPVRDRYVRPLLEVGRGEIAAYARQRNLEWAEDASNQKTVYFRNRVRHELLPFLEEEYQPGLRGRLRETAVICREWKAVLEEPVNAALQRGGLVQSGGRLTPNRDGGYLLPIALWRELPPAVQRLLFRRLFFSLSPAHCCLEFVHSEAVLALLEAPEGKRINLPGGMLAWKREQALWIGPATAAIGEQGGANWTAVVLVVPGTTVLPANLGTVESKWLTRNELPLHWEEVSPFEFYLDADRCSFPLTLRPRRSGDRLAILGLDGSKKVKDVLIDAKIPPDERGAYPLLVDGDSRVLGVLGLRPGRQGMISPQTGRVLYLHYRRRNR